jgi:hypothetical protein
MTEAQFISKIRLLKEIKPRKGWVVLTKKQIFGEEKARNSKWNLILDIFPRVFFRWQPAVAVFAVFLLGAFTLAQSSAPGDLLYSVKKITEQTQKPFVPEKEFNIKIVNNRLDDLAKVAQSNSTKNLAPAINEYKASVSEVAKNLTNEETKKNPQELKKIVKELQNIEKKTAEVESLGMVVGEDIELDSALVELIRLQAQDLENRTLTQEQIKSIGDIKADIEAGKYSDALEKILELNQNQ